MAHLWFQNPNSEWCRLTLAGDAIELAPVLGSAAEGAALHRERHESWVLVAPVGVELRRNGRPLAVNGLAVLRDRDLVGLAGASFFFSTEALARVEAFPAAARESRCARCRQVIGAGAAAVSCPACSAWHHQEADLPCFTYGPGCGACLHPTAMGDGVAYRFFPGEL